MTALPTTFPRVPLKQMDPSMLVFELDRETARLMAGSSELITSAATMASFLHRSQTRFVRGDMDRVPYIEHPLRVALRLIRWGARDAELIAAALLHDVVEDCANELIAVFGEPGENAMDCLARLYGPQVAALVDQVTNPGACSSSSAEACANYMAHVEGMARRMQLSLLIKASDLKDNAGSIKHQLGHGKDAKMLRMLAKYLPVVALVVEGVSGMAAQTGSSRERLAAARSASVDLKVMLADLRQLAVERGVDA